MDYYTLEKSSDGVVFESINTQQAQGNGRSNRNQYKYLDTKPHLGVNYYRLGQVDVDGTQTYSKVVAINFETNHSLLLP